MQGPIIVRDPYLHVTDFDAAEDEPPFVHDSEDHHPPHWLSMPGIDKEFTTEWQMESPEDAEHAAAL